MSTKALKVISIGLALLLLLSVITIAVLSTILALKTKDIIDFSVPNANIEQAKSYDLSNVNFKSIADNEESDLQMVNVSCKIKPFNATNKNLNWTLNWKNPNSEWASEKTATDYVQVVPKIPDTRNATITMLQPFGEIIILTVTSVSNPEVSQSVELRCIAELDFVTSFVYKDVEYSFNKDGFSDGKTKLILNGSNYNGYPSGEPDAFELNTKIYGAVSTNNDVEPFVLFKLYIYNYITVIYQSDYYTLTYDYINNFDIKVPLIESKQNEVLPTSFRNYEGVNVGDELDVSKNTVNISTMNHLLTKILNYNVNKGKNVNSYATLEIKFLGTGTTLEIRKEFV